MIRISIPSFIGALWVLSLILPSMTTAQPQAAGMIRGKVLNGTTGGTEVADVEVTVHQYSGGQEQQRGSTKTKEDGTFSFSGLSLEKEKTYYLRALYQGVEYYSPTVAFEDKKELLLDLSVYEPTDKDTQIFVKMHHVFMEFKEGVLFIQEIMVLENHGDRVYVGSREVEPGKKEVLRISLPKKATAFEPLKGLMGCCIVQTEDGFIDTMDIKPGRKEIRFSYKVDYGSSRYKLSKRLYAKTESIDFLIPDKGIKAKSDMLEFRGSMGNPGQRFLHLKGKDLVKGSRIVLELKGLPWGKGLFKMAVVGLVVVIMGAGLSYPFMRKWLRKGESGGPGIMGPEQPTPVDRRQELVQEIAYLDDLFESGEIDPEEYRSKRKQMMEEVKEITREVRNLTSMD
ncbi:MAG: carboxypeptidase-like regulatory domain-containing protein [Thermodesulfobacteriota bacterium]